MLTTQVIKQKKDIKIYAFINVYLLYPMITYNDININILLMSIFLEFQVL